MNNIRIALTVATGFAQNAISLIKDFCFRYIRFLIFFIWRFWLRKVHGIENIPINEPAIIVSNHVSYFDFFILSAILKKQTVFIANKKLATNHGFITWTMKLNPIIFIDREQLGLDFYRTILRYLTFEKRHIVIYPEGTRSRTGRMLKPSLGFVKFAIKAGVPIIPIAMKGTYEILPPHKYIPKLRRCEVFIGKKIYISPGNEKLHDIFYKNMASPQIPNELDDSQLQEIAFRIMEQIRIITTQAWDESVVPPNFISQ